MLRALPTLIGPMALPFLVNALAAAMVAIVALAISISTITSIRTSLLEDAERAVARLADATVGDAVENADLSSWQALAAFEEARHTIVTAATNIFAYQVYDDRGRLRRALHRPTMDPGLSYAERSAMLERALRTNTVQAAIAERDPKDARPAIATSVYIPIGPGAEPIAVFVGQVDQTLDHARRWERAVAVLAATGVLAALALCGSAITAWMLLRHRMDNARIHHLAHHDELTGLANRTTFRAEVERRLRVDRRSDSQFAVHLLDLDGFKAVNDTLGHAAGDELLRRVAARLRSVVRPQDTIARVGGDEFVILQPDVTDLGEVTRFADCIVAAVANIDAIDGVPIDLSTSLGIALAPQHAVTVEELQQCADVALYRAKEEGRNRRVVFEEGMDAKLREHNMLRVKLREALSGEGLALHFQPLHRANGGDLIGFEALLRLGDGEGGLIGPNKFIPVAEEMGLTGSLGAWVVREACFAAVAWPSNLSVAVNLSAQQFDGSIVEVVRSALSDSRLEPGRLELEITESLFIRNPEAVATQLHALKALGANIVMDDFGTGYSSLSYLWQFPFDKLKVDRSCFQSLDGGGNVPEVLRTISAMGAAMNLRITAEGVETELQREFAANSGYHEVQGFLYSKPMPGAAVASYIKTLPLDGHASSGQHLNAAA